MNGTLKFRLGCVTCLIDVGRLDAPVKRVTFTSNPAVSVLVLGAFDFTASTSCVIRGEKTGHVHRGACSDGRACNTHCHHLSVALKKGKLRTSGH